MNDWLCKIINTRKGKMTSLINLMEGKQITDSFKNTWQFWKFTKQAALNSTGNVFSQERQIFIQKNKKTNKINPISYEPCSDIMESNDVQYLSNG